MNHLSDHEILYAVLRQDFAAFIEKVFQVVSPSDRFLPNWHIEAMADHLMQCILGDKKRLIITVPPRGLKSICASVALPAWALGHNPSRRVICASYGYDLAAKHSRDFRAVLEAPWYRRTFPYTRLKRMIEYDLETTQKGVRFAASVGGPLTGRGGNLIIIDDPMKPEDGLSAVKRQAVKEWYDTTVFSRLDSKADGVIIIVMQRLHVDDLIAHVLEKEDWTVLNLPAIAPMDEEFVLSDDRCFTWREGEVLHPEREPLHVLENIKNNIGTSYFSAQYLQQPVPLKGNLIQWEWFEFYDKLPPREGGDEIVQSWDTAMKATERSDYSVCTTWQIKGERYLIADVYRDRLDYPALRKTVIEQAKKWKTDVLLMEDSASGTALIQDIRSQNAPGVPYPTAVKPTDDKVVRMARPSAKIEAGHVYLRRNAEWLGEFKNEFMAFPEGAHDDQVDSVSQFLNWVDERSSRKVYMRKLVGF